MKQIKGIRRAEKSKKLRYGMKVDSKSVFIIQIEQNKRKWAIEARESKDE